MNKKIIIAMVMINVLVALAGVWWLERRKTRHQENIQQSVKEVQQQRTTQADVLNSRVAQEFYNTNILIRGKLIRYDPQQQILALAPDRQTYGPSVEIVINNTRELLCWPEQITTVDGIQVNTTGAFVMVTRDSPLYIKGQTKQLLAEVLPQVPAGTPLVARLADLPKPDQTWELDELAVIGCPDET